VARKAIDIMEDIREKRHLTKDAFAQIIGERRTYYSQTVHRGGEPGADRFREWCVRLGVDPMTGADLGAPPSIEQILAPVPAVAARLADVVAELLEIHGGTGMHRQTIEAIPRLSFLDGMLRLLRYGVNCGWMLTGEGDALPSRQKKKRKEA